MILYKGLVRLLISSARGMEAKMPVSPDSVDIIQSSA